MGEKRCPLCRGLMTDCFMVTGGGHLTELHGTEKRLGISVNRSGVRSEVCVDCGFVAVYARQPGVFRREAERRRNQDHSELAPAPPPEGAGSEMAPGE